MKMCKVCGVVKPYLDFTPRPDSVDGHAHQCKACKNAKTRAWQKSNLERVKTNKARYYATDKGKAQKRRSDEAYVNTGGRAVVEAKRAARPLSEARKAARRKWAKNNTAYLHAQKLYRRALVRNLPDFDLWVLQEAVLLAKQRETVVGGKWHVDHITPVSKGGSSAHTNVQVVPALWNRRKSNKHTNKLFGA